MCTDYLVDQEVPNTAESEIGRNWSELVEIPNFSSIEHIEETLKEI